MTAQETDGLSADQLTEVRKAAMTVFDSGEADPHLKKHLWDLCMRIDGKIKELGDQESTVG